VIAKTDGGDCVFHDPGLGGGCRIHARLGESALPAACRHFPRVFALDPGGPVLRLSHACREVAARLVEPGHRGAVEIVEAPRRLIPAGTIEGLDGRQSLPPLLRPGCLASWPAYGLWERLAVRTLGTCGTEVHEALEILADCARRLRQWTPADGSLERAVERAGESLPDTAAACGTRDSAILHALVRSCVPLELRPPEPPRDLETADARWVRPLWTQHQVTVRRYLAAHAFGSWVGRIGSGLLTGVAYLVAAQAVLRAEAGRVCASAARPLDARALAEAARLADRLLVHLAEPEQLARRLSVVESAGLAALSRTREGRGARLRSAGRSPGRMKPLADSHGSPPNR